MSDASPTSFDEGAPQPEVSEPTRYEPQEQWITWMEKGPSPRDDDRDLTGS